MATYKYHRLECGSCNHEENVMEWSDRLPARCKECGGQLYLSGTNVRAGVSQAEQIMDEMREEFEEELPNAEM